MRFKIDEIWIDSDAEDAPLTHNILVQLPQADIVKADDIPARLEQLQIQNDPLSTGKRILRLMKHKGAFLKPCPGTNEYICCDLEILHIGQGCPMDCRYCALQVYFNRPVMEIFVNTDDMFPALENHLKSKPEFHRICTGEFTDSLALDPLTNLSSRLVEFFNHVSNASLEFKSKTDFIEPLLSSRSKGKVVVGFSMNAETIQRNDELRAVPILDRLKAAAKAIAQGYYTAFHFDPIIPIPNWQELYSKTIAAIFECVDPKKIAWISLGVLRFVPELRDLAALRFGRIPYFHDGFLRGLDGKSRLDVDRRIGIYRFMADRIRSYHTGARIYLCMESYHVWKNALGIEMNNDDQLSAYLNSAFQ